jgi:hypothetical protein
VTHQDWQFAEKLDVVIPGRAEGAIPESITPPFPHDLMPWLWIPALASLGRNDHGEGL